MGFSYKNRIVSFIDILGLSDHLKNPDRAAEFARSVTHALLAILPRDHKLRKWRDIPTRHVETLETIELRAPYSKTFAGNYTLISDSIVFSIPDTAKFFGPDDETYSGRHYAIIECARVTFWIQRHLLQLGILTRGGISSGGLFHNENVVVGAGLVSAYTIEKSNAIFPRVVMSPDLVHHLISNAEAFTEASRSRISHLLRQDNDGVYFVDYLGVGHQRAEVDWCHRLSKIAKFVTSELHTRRDLRIRQKLSWLAVYIEQSKIAVGDASSQDEPPSMFPVAFPRLNAEELLKEFTEDIRVETEQINEPEQKPQSSFLCRLTLIEERVLRMRFGIGMNTDHTLEEVGQQFSVTRERIRQIEAKALRKLKHPSRSRKLRSFLDN